MKLPVNVKLFDVKQDIMQSGYLPIGSQFIFDPVTKNLHPEGIFSEVIFGLRGSRERFTKFGYIDLRTKILHPQVHNNLISMKALYKDVMKGIQYAKFDTQVKDLVAVSDSSEGSTGYSFFMDTLPKIKLRSTGSMTRDDKITIIEKYKDKIYLDGFYLVLPCAVREIQEGDTVGIEEINKLYLNLYSLTLTLPENGNTTSPIFDGIKNRIQDTANLIFDYISNLMEGKHGFGRGKLGGRNIALGSRNVVTSAPLSEVESPDSPRYFKNDEVMLPLIQAAKSLTPVVAHHLLKSIFSTVFTHDQVSLINKKTLALQYVKVSDEKWEYFTTIDGAVQFIDECLNEHVRQKPVEVDDYYLYLVYDDTDTIILFRNIDEVRNGLFPTLDTTSLPSINLDIIFGPYSVIKAAGYNGLAPDNLLDGYVSSKDVSKLLSLGFIKDGDGYRKDNLYFTVSNVDNKDIKITNNIRYLSEQKVLEYFLNNPSLKHDRIIKWLRPLVFDDSKVRPITYGELLYISTFISSISKYTTSTRYPVLNDVGIITGGIHLLSTEVNRQVLFRNILSGNARFILPRYPVVGSPYQESMCPHPSTLPGFDGDFDGDMFTTIPLLSDEANRENDEYRDSVGSMVNISKGLVRGLSQDDMVKYTFYSMSYKD